MASSSELELVRRRLLGWSLAFEEVEPGGDIGRDLVLDGGLAVVDGVDNLAQALAVALTTALGADIFNTSFGFDGLNAVADEPDPTLARERVRVAVVQMLLRDPRVRRILDLRLEDATLTDPVERRRTAAIRVAFETVGAGAVAAGRGRSPFRG